YYSNYILKIYGQRITFFFAVPISVGVGPEPGEIEKSTAMLTVEAPTIYDGVNIANTIIGKKVNFSHAKLIIISKELAERGVEKFINTFNKYREFRPNTYIGVSKGSAEEFLKETKPILEVNPAKYFELIMESYKFTGYTLDSKLEDFYRRMKCTCNEPVAVLLDVNKVESSDDFAALVSNARLENGKSEKSYKAGEIPVNFDNKANGMGLAVFKSDKMIGEMNSRETVSFLMVSNMLNRVNYSIPEPSKYNDPEDRNYVSLRLKRARNTSIKVKMKGEIPYITIKVFLEGDILAVDSDKDYSKGEELKKLEDFAAHYIKKEIEDLMEKTVNEFKSDICAIGKSLKIKYLTWDDWLNLRWSEKYEKAEFEVITNISVRRSGMTLKQFPVVDLKGE
ncbi:MAG: Ger(x)C family spore germination protein, partial [Clostridiaceae bacterium]|nr:Ger(x)C family spore germination protein [Clostridiaceae bacterium]